MIRTLTLAALVTLPLVACESSPGAAPAVGSGTTAKADKPAGLPDRDPALAKKLLAEGAVLIDVRTPQEFAGGHATGATLIPVSDIGSRLAEVEKLTGGDKNKPIVVYCASGARSGTAKNALLKAGYTKVTNVGGLSALR